MYAKQTVMKTTTLLLPVDKNIVIHGSHDTQCCLATIVEMLITAATASGS